MWDLRQTPFPLAILPEATALAGWVLLLLTVVWGLRSDQPGKTSGSGRWIWWILLGGVLVLFRWPLIALPHELYPDESQLLAGALTLRHDPVFWRSVDGGTAGPLDYFAVVPAAFFPGAAGYAATRLTAVLLVWGTIIAAGETLALITSRRVAQVAILPALAFEALTTSPEFVHYSTELVPGCLLALAVLAIVRQTLRPARGNLWVAALLLGAFPFAKLQAAPIAAVLGLFLVGHEITAGRSRHVGLLAGAALLPTLFFTALVTVTGQAEQMVIPYFLQNTLYASTGRQSLGQVLHQFGEQSVTNGYHALWLAGSALFCTGAVLYSRHATGPLRRHALAAAGLLGVTAFVILSPGRPYHHYLNLLTLPVTLLAGVALGLVVQARADRPAFVLAVFLACTLLPQLVLRASPRPDPYEYYNITISARGPAYRELVARIKSLTLPGESLGIWGWRSSLYIETGRHQATRLAHTEALLVGGRWQKFYLRRYYDDMVAANPPVIVDATGPGNFRFESRSVGLEVYPLLFAWVSAHYSCVGEVDGTRLYVRRDRLQAAQ
jgi:hypothetical protein